MFYRADVPISQTEEKKRNQTTIQMLFTVSEETCIFPQLVPDGDVGFAHVTSPDLLKNSFGMQPHV